MAKKYTIHTTCPVCGKTQRFKDYPGRYPGASWGYYTGHYEVSGICSPECAGPHEVTVVEHDLAASKE